MIDTDALIKRLDLIEASASLILDEAAKIRKALQPSPVKKKEGLTDEQKARLIARMRAKEARQLRS